MPERVIALSGKSIEVATMADIDRDAYTLLPATTTVLGGVKKAATVANCEIDADGTSAGKQPNALLT